ncbi:MAG: hypothetical protein IE923_04425 [Micrococcales bacterium]|nr:hypothetical protein [Micrococcales bacterium]
MSSYRIFFTQVVSTSVEVEADDLNDAIDKAYESGDLPSSNFLCAHCSGWGQGYSIDTGEWEADEKAYMVDGESVEVPR